MGKAQEVEEMLRAEEKATKPYGDARVWFDYHTELSHEKTAEAGRAQYDKILVLCVQHVGDPEPFVKRAKKGDIQYYASEYKEFMEGKTGPKKKDGLPLIEWSMMPRSLAKQLEVDWGIEMLEELADLPETRGDVYSKLGPAQDWCKKAKDELETSKKRGAITSLKAENKKLTAHVQSLTEQVRRLSQRLEMEQGPNVGNLT